MSLFFPGGHAEIVIEIFVILLSIFRYCTDAKLANLFLDTASYIPQTVLFFHVRQNHDSVVSK
jgi:hypothetical protein